MSSTLRKLIRYSQRAGRILLTHGPGVLVQAIERHLRAPPPEVKRDHTLLRLPEPLEPLCLPDFPRPTASVVISMGGDPRMTHHCLAALQTNRGVYSYEVILVDETSNGESEEWRRLWGNVRVVASPSSGFAAACEQAAEVARGTYLICLSDHTQVQSGWLDKLIDTFDIRVDAGAVGSRLIYPDGRQMEAGGIVFKDGTLWRYGCRDDPYRPEYSYLRAVDFCSWICLAIRRSLFIELEGFDADPMSLDYWDIDLAFRVRQAGFSVYYQPLSEVVSFDEDGSDDHETAGTIIGSGATERARFVERWIAALQGHGPRTASIEAEAERFVSRRAFFSDFAVPTPDRDSGSLRMVNLFAILQDVGFKITFASMGLESRQPYLSDLQARGVECLYRPYEDSIEEHLRRQGVRYDLVILSRAETAAELMDVARRWCPRAKILFDTVDLHFQRIARQAAIFHDARINRIAKRVKRQELDLIEAADTTLVVSEAEKSLLAVEAPGADVRVVSNIHKIYGCAKPFAARNGILFIGGFAHPPNTDAVIFFCRNVFPWVSAVLSDVQFYVIGSDPPFEVRELAGEKVHVLGYVADVEPYLADCRLSVAPLRFGAGVKGKINLSLAHGLPVVASSMAAEGMFLDDGESALIADDARDFADAILRLYRDEALWNRLSLGGLAVMEKHFSFRAARKAVAELLAP